MWGFLLEFHGLEFEACVTFCQKQDDFCWNLEIFLEFLFVNMSCWRKTDFCEIVQQFVICLGAEDTFDDYFEHDISTHERLQIVSYISGLNDL